MTLLREECATYCLGMSATNHEIRERTAQEAFTKLGGSPSEKAKLTVHCSKGHHLGSVYDTEAGRIFHSVLTSRGRGRKDMPDSRHTASDRGRDWFDLLDAGDDPLVSDELQTGCACGPYLLSRRVLTGQIQQGEKRLIIES